MSYLKFRVSNLTKRELERVIEQANLTDTQTKIVLELNREQRDDLGIMILLNLPRTKYYAEKRIALKKIVNVLENP